jgi:hypothetical protein
MSIPMNVAAGQVGDPGFGRNSLGAGGVNYRICRLGYFTKRAFGGVRLTGKFGEDDGAASYPQRGWGGPGIFLTSASCSTSSQGIDFLWKKTVYPDLLGGLADLLGGLS